MKSNKATKKVEDAKKPETKISAQKKRATKIINQTNILSSQNIFLNRYILGQNIF